LANVDLRGKRAVVTGGASGIGVETVRALARAGAEVTIAARKLDVAAAVATEVSADTGNDDVGFAPLELTDRDSVDAFVAAWDGPLDILVNNAGVMAIQELTLGRDGHEMQFETNHLGHFRLALGLHDALAAAPGGARIVAVSSTAHLTSPVVFDDVDFRFRPYDPILAYAQSKTATILFAVGADRRWSGDGIRANALNPGAILTGLQRHTGGRLITPPELHKTPEQGAATSTLLAASPLLEGVGGRYFNDCQEAEPVDRRPDIDGSPDSFRAITNSVAPYALEADNADRLWGLSEALLG
jgi:NAD(P)-dependent dehydrogenase (short-subunit alcohol dehydrogenase family)